MARPPIQLILAAAIATLSGCEYGGVGHVVLRPAPVGAAVPEGQAESADAVATMTGTFDGLLTARHGEVYTFTAYRVPRNDEKFRHYFNRYKKDHPFTQAELVVSFDTAGNVAPPILSFKQGERTILRGELIGEIDVTATGDELTVTGEGMVWRLDSGRDLPAVPTSVDFLLRTDNVLRPPADSR